MQHVCNSCFYPSSAGIIPFLGHVYYIDTRTKSRGETQRINLKQTIVDIKKSQGFIIGIRQTQFL